MTIRESTLGRALFGFLAGLWMLFATCVALTGDKVTSRQWTYLMGVPGGKWFWSFVFALGALAVVYGLVCRIYRLTSVGMFVIGTACLLISAFYVCAPLIDPGLLTLGYCIWFLGAAVGYFAAVVSWAPIRWF